MQRKPIYLIKWRNRNYGNSRAISEVVTSASHFLTRESAQKQADLFKSKFPQNSYYVESAQ